MMQEHFLRCSVLNRIFGLKASGKVARDGNAETVLLALVTVHLRTCGGSSGLKAVLVCRKHCIYFHSSSKRAYRRSQKSEVDDHSDRSDRWMGRSYDLDVICLLKQNDGGSELGF